MKYDVDEEEVEEIFYVKDGEVLEDYIPEKFAEFTWYEVKGGTEPFDIEAEIKADITLYGVSA